MRQTITTISRQQVIVMAAIVTEMVGMIVESVIVSMSIAFMYQCKEKGSTLSGDAFSVTRRVGPLYCDTRALLNLFK